VLKCGLLSFGFQHASRKCLDTGENMSIPLDTIRHIVVQYNQSLVIQNQLARSIGKAVGPARLDLASALDTFPLSDASA
jgi:hypothetical protein